MRMPTGTDFRTFLRRPAVAGVLLGAIAAGAGALIPASSLLGPSPPEVRFRASTTAAQDTAVRIEDHEFGPLIDRLSEPEGYFDTDNFISNETSYLHVVGRLHENVRPGGAYFGVGPDQNFTYIVHTLPEVAIVADIRRQNMLEHLLLKVLIQSADDRGDFLCALFARDCATGVDSEAGLETILERVASAPADPDRLEETLGMVLASLENNYHVSLSDTDAGQIAYVHRSFARAGPNLRFSSFGGNNVDYPTFAELMLETDSEGARGSYLASEELFARLGEFQSANRLIPIVGDFAGDRALGAAADYLREIDVPVSVVYTSNVEYYLFGSPNWERWVSNVGAFTFREDAAFVRAYFPTYGRPHPENVPGYRPTTIIQSVQGFLDDAASGRLASYWDVVARHNF